MDEKQVCKVFRKSVLAVRVIFKQIVFYTVNPFPPPPGRVGVETLKVTSSFSPVSFTTAKPLHSLVGTLHYTHQVVIVNSDLSLVGVEQVCFTK